MRPHTNSDTRAPMVDTTTIGGLLLNAAAEFPDREAVVFPTFRWTYGKIVAESMSVARSLIAIQVSEGDTVAIIAPNGSHYLSAYFGAVLAGAIPVPVNTRYRKVGLQHVLKDSRPTAVMVSRDLHNFQDIVHIVGDTLGANSEGVQTDGATLVIMGGCDEDRTRLAAGSQAILTEDEFAAGESSTAADVVMHRIHQRPVRSTGAILYTSGTSSAPKGCELSHEAIVRMARTMNAYRLSLTPEDRVWTPCPLFHIGATTVLLATLTSGAAFVSDSKFDPTRACTQLVRERISVAYPIFQGVALPLIDDPAWSTVDVRGIRIVVCIGSPENLRRIQRAFGNATHMNAYGMTEMAGMNIMTHPDKESPEQSATAAGHPLPGVVLRIVEIGTTELLGEDQDGELQVRSWCTFDRYYGDSESTAKVVSGDGWVSTGDVGRITPEGRFVFRGRIKDMLKVGGENVAAVEIEDFLTELDGVRVAAVIGVSDERLDEVPVAFVELESGSGLTPEEVIRCCRGQLASYQVPVRVVVVRADEWPMSATKIQKYRLHELL